MNLRQLARLATAVENGERLPPGLPEGAGITVGITGPPGAGKSTLADVITLELRKRGKTVAILAVDPSSRASGGAILGDRIRMGRHHADPGVFVRSTATRGATGGIARSTANLSRLFLGAGFDFVIIETVGTGQDEIDIAGHADVTLIVLVPGMGDGIQAMKAGIMEIADVFVINKADRPGAEQTEREIALEHKPVFRTAAIDGTGVDALVSHIEKVERRPRATVENRGIRIDHLGIAVRSLNQALPFFENDIGLPLGVRETVEHEKVQLAMLAAGESRIELLEPLNADSPIARFIEKRGPGLHHVALRVPDLAAVLRRLEASGIRVLGPPQHGAGGHLYVFLHPAGTGGVLWELIQD